MTQRRIADIEMLRGVAVGLVVLHHCKSVLIGDNSGRLNALFSFFDFWIGVDIFFAISGFVVARSLMPLLDSSATTRQFFINTASFWLKRMWRLWPSAWLLLALILVAVLFANRAGGFGSITANIEATVVALLQVANFRFADVVTSHFEYGASFVYWSLSQEEQFYLLLPLLIFILRRRLAAALAVVLLVKGVLALLFPEINSMLLLILLRSDALLLGVLLAIWSEQPSYRLFEPTLFSSRLARWTLWPVLLACLCALASDNLRILPNPFRYSVIGMLATVPVFILSYDRNYIVGAGMLRRVLLWLGSRSYGIYLIHVPAFLLTKEIWFRLSPAGTIFDNAFNLPFALTATALVLCCSELNYRVVENPLRRHGLQVADKFLSHHRLISTKGELV